MASAEQNERETYRLIVLSRDGTKVLLVPSGERRMLPSVEIPRWQRVAENLTAAVESSWGEEVVCLFARDTDSPTDGAVNSYQAAEHLCTRSSPRMPTYWAPVSTLSQDSLADECDYAAIKQVTAVCNGEMGAASAGPFSRLGWFSELHNWIESVVEPIGFHVNGRFQQLNASPSFSLIRFETSGPAVWFKAVGEPNQREFPITCTLARLFPSHLPNVLATRPDWNAWLTRESEGRLLGDEQESGTWERVAALLAELQINSCDRVPAIAGAGARDLSVGTLRKQIRPFVDITQQLMQQQPKTPPPTLDRKELLALGDRIGEALDFLEALEIPETLGHLDLNPGNIVVSATTCVLLDWAEAYVGNPFLTFQYLLEHFRRSHPRDSSRESQVLESYAAPWSRILSRDAIHAGLTVAPLLAVFSYVCGTGLLGDGERLKQTEFAGYLRGLARRMDREAHALGWEQEMHYTSSHLTKPNVALSEQEISPGYSEMTRFSLFLRAYSKLLRFDRYLARRDFAGLYRAVRTAPCMQKSADTNAMERICHTVDLACIWYWKEVLCLQRSAATTCLLRNFGIPARMILGVQQTPFRAHAWVEADGQVINDRQYMRDLYKVIDIC